jgi:hypothetical protein
MRSRIMRTLGVAMMTCILAQPATGDSNTPSLSRYVVHVVPVLVPPGVAVTTVDQAPLEERCKDNDGCEIVLTGSIDPTNPMAVAAKRFVTFIQVWSVDGSTFLNADGNPDLALFVDVFDTSTSFGTCSFSDVDGSEGTDWTLAFSVKSDSTGNDFIIYCTLTVID